MSLFVTSADSRVAAECVIDAFIVSLFMLLGLLRPLSQDLVMFGYIGDG